eukprot:TRINITY_DN748_c0_g1_i26.p5 TRINITY_DN748_c0_g1~~TRINITY_DN748_c0_g1_i26.p5  ORF type:complete len:154 (+),score=15.20 TRINITY_DN748_c0_g1_i26:87-548(+)
MLWQNFILLSYRKWSLEMQSLWIKCSSKSGYYEVADSGVQKCKTCGSNCVSCTSDTVCTKCDETSSYSLDVSTNGCVCITCTSDTVCTKCNEASSYSIDVSTNGCVLCSSKSGYYEVADSGLCSGKTSYYQVTESGVSLEMQNMWIKLRIMYF